MALNLVGSGSGYPTTTDYSIKTKLEFSSDACGLLDLWLGSWLVGWLVG
jgi:hypothetical protein